MATPEKPRREPRTQRVPKHGRGRLNSGGSFPGSGRPPNEFRRTMAAIADDEDARKYLLACIRGKHGAAAAASAREYATERGYGKVPAKVELGGEDGKALEIVVTHRIVDASAD